MIPHNRLPWIMAILCVSWIIVNIYFIKKAFAGDNQVDAIYISHLRQTLSTNSQLKDNNFTAIAINDDEYKEIIHFQAYMDSLKKSAYEVYDSIILLRPGLMDSVQLFQLMYNHQKNRKHE